MGWGWCFCAFGQVNQPEYEYDRDAAKAHRRAAFAAEKSCAMPFPSEARQATNPPRSKPNRLPQDSFAKRRSHPFRTRSQPQKDQEKGRNKDLFNPDDEDTFRP